MSDEPKPPPSRGRKAPATNVQIPSNIPKLKAIVPYVIAGVLLLGLVLLMRSPGMENYGGLGMGVVVLVLANWVGLSHRTNLKPDDQLRSLLPVMSLVVCGATIAPYAYAILPHPSRAELTFTQAASEQTVQVPGNLGTAWVVIRGAFVPSATGSPDYFLRVSSGAQPVERIDGALVRDTEPGASATAALDRKLLSQPVQGSLRVRLERVTDAVQLPVRVEVHARPFSVGFIGLFYVVLALGIIVIDVMISQRRIESAYAAAMLVPLVGTLYFLRNPAALKLTDELLAAGIVGGLGGGLGGELVARAFRGFFVR